MLLCVYEREQKRESVRLLTLIYAVYCFDSNKNISDSSDFYLLTSRYINTKCLETYTIRLVRK
jgi:hypothetical protein